MRLARKLILSMVLGLTVVLAANSFYRVRRELAAFDEDMKQDHDVMAQVLESAVTSVWATQGRDAALRLIANTKPPSKMLHLRWVDGQGAHGEGSTSGVLVTRVAIA